MGTPRPRVLVIDDGQAYAEMIEQQLTEFELVAPKAVPHPGSAPDGPSAVAFLQRHRDRVDVILLDMHFDLPAERLLPLGPEVSPRHTRRFQGLAILREIRQHFPELPVVLLTSVEDLSLVDLDGQLAAQSMTYILDGTDLDTLRIRINAALREARGVPEDEKVLWGRDRAVQAIRRRLSIVARGSLPVMLVGDTGTGKSFVAEHFVHPRSNRRGPFVTLDLASIPPELIPVHLFGARRGAYTGSVADQKGAFELAHGGTLFIDEVQNIPLLVQRQLLVVLQDRRVRPLGGAADVAVDVKVVVAANQPLAAAVQGGQFRQDLYMRLNPTTQVRLPPLRERRSDLPFLIRRLLDRAVNHPDNRALYEEVAASLGVESVETLQLVVGRDAEGPAAPGLSLAVPAPVWGRLLQHDWPGNLRELAMVVHNVVGFTLVAAVDAVRSGVLLASHRLQVDPGLVGELLQASGSPAGARAAADSADRIPVAVRPASTLNNVARDVERQYLRALFGRTRGDFARMAELLLDEPGKARAVRLRFNQIGLKVRQLRNR